MTLLGWMHRKLMHNNSIGPAQIHTKEQTLSEHGHRCHTDPPKRFSPSNNIFQQQFEPFELLSIGTLGTQFLDADSPMPAVFPTLTTEQIEIAESELNLIISHELEKFLEAEEHHPHVVASNNKAPSSETSSNQESVTTLSFKGNKGDIGDHEAAAVETAANRPLKNYLFAAPVELAETGEREWGRSRERTSLAELFKRNKVVRDEDEEEDDNDDDVPVRKSCEGDVEHGVNISNNAARFVKKVAKKFRSSSGDENDSYPTKKKFYKSLAKMFENKVYPEETVEKEFLNLGKGNKKTKNFNEKSSGTTKKTRMKLPSWPGICRGASPANGAHWIKTDSDSDLVLEL